MRSAFSSFAHLLVACGLVISAAFVITAQNRERFGISAKAGGVNATSGRAEVRSAPGADWQLLNVTDDLRTGDSVRTGRDGLVEMLLNPGAYLRVAENSEFELTNNSLDALEVRLIRGTAVIEATGSDDTELAINITTPHARMVIVRRGLYRVNVVPGDNTELIVRKGRVLLAHSNTKIKSGDKVVFSSTTFSVAKLGKADKQKDTFEAWSKERAGTLAQANRQITARSLDTFLSSRDSWSAEFSARSYGIWYYNARFGCYTFLPFLFGWGSPYGNSYSNTFYYGGYACCGGIDWRGGRIMTSPPVAGNNYPGTTTTTGTASSPGSGGTRINPVSVSAPPSTVSRPTRDAESPRPMPRSDPADRGRPNQR
jgi:hypothetical protein